MRKLLLALVLTPNITWAFDYPAGIPNAWIAPDVDSPAPPSTWTTEITNKYYIDISDSNCSTKVTYGSASEPRCRLPTSLSAGAYVEIHGGTYDYTSTVRILSQGTEDQPVWIVGADDNLMKMSMVLYGTYLYIDGLNIEGDKGIEIRPYRDTQTDHLMIRNTTITGTGSLSTGTTGISAAGANGLEFEGFIAYNNTISYQGDSESTTENDRHALVTKSYINSVWFLNNTTHHNGGDGVQFSHGGKEAHHFYYGGNISHDERENCVDIKQANDVVVSGNTCYNIEHSSSSPGEGMVVHYDPSRIWFINNDISNTVYGIISTGALDVHVVGNNIHNINEYSGESHGNISSYQTGGGIVGYNTGSMYISNNTITDAVRGIAYEAVSAKEYEVKITGNIIANLHNGKYTDNSPYAIMLKGNETTVTNAEVENNLFYNPMQLYIYNTTYTDLRTLEASGKCDDNGKSCLDTNPSFVSTESYRLMSGSSAINSGKESSSFSDFQTLYGTDLSIAVDIDGNDRTSNPDIGAYEYVGESTGSIPSAPTAFSVESIN